MKTYNITLNAAQPVRKVLAVPANTQRFGVVVKAENIDGSNLTCSMVDGGETIEATRQEDGAFMFDMSSAGEERDREVKIVLATEAINIGHQVTEYEGEIGTQVRCSMIELPAGKYKNADIQGVGVLKRPAPYKLSTNESGNLVGFARIWVYPLGEAAFADAQNQPIADDVEVEVLAPTKFSVNKVTTAKPEVSPDVYLGENVASYHDVVLDESRFAVPDGDIEIPDTDIEVSSITVGGVAHDVEWKTITVGGEEIIVIGAKNTGN